MPYYDPYKTAYEDSHRQLGEILWALTDALGIGRQSVSGAMSYWGELAYKERDELVYLLEQIEAARATSERGERLYTPSDHVWFDATTDLIHDLNRTVAGIEHPSRGSEYDRLVGIQGDVYGRFLQYALEVLLPKAIHNLGERGFGNEILQDLQIEKVYPGIVYNAQPAIEDLGAIVTEHQDLLNVPEEDGEKRPASILAHLFGDIGERVTDPILWLLDRLKQAVAWTIEIQARWVWAMLNRVVDVLWEDEDMDFELPIEYQLSPFEIDNETRLAIDRWIEG